ncbi:alpha/beta hydrolase [Aquisalinus flavus]|nr:alpha/beta hydrolase [Aquisalinus flavus]
MHCLKRVNMFKRRSKICTSISAEAQMLYPNLKSYGAFDGLSNKLTRNLARELVHRVWRAARDEVDFPYSVEACSLGGVPGQRISAGEVAPDCPVIFYVHAGAFVCGSAEINAGAVLPTCHLAGCEAWGVDYALAPEHPFPAGLDDVTSFYLALRERVGPDRKIIGIGDSAGANLLLSSMMSWRDSGIALPDRAVFISSCLDGTASSDTVITMQKHDPLIRIEGPNSLKSVFRYYANGADLSDWRISPINGDMTGLPPMLIHVGSREALLGDSARLSEKARRSGVDVALRVFDGMFHMFHLHWSLPEARACHEDIADFIRR